MLVRLAQADLRLLVLVVQALEVLNVLVELGVLVLKLANRKLLSADSLVSGVDLLVLEFLGLAQVNDSSVVGVNFLLHGVKAGREASVVELSDVDEVLESGDLLVVFVGDIDCISVLEVQSLDILSLSVNLGVH